VAQSSVGMPSYAGEISSLQCCRTRLRSEPARLACRHISCGPLVSSRSQPRRKGPISADKAASMSMRRLEISESIVDTPTR
jgi:hypothetical protein